MNELLLEFLQNILVKTTGANLEEMVLDEVDTKPANAKYPGSYGKWYSDPNRTPDSYVGKTSKGKWIPAVSKGRKKTTTPQSDAESTEVQTAVDALQKKYARIRRVEVKRRTATLLDAIKTKDSAIIERVIAETGLKFSQTGKLIFMIDGIRHNVESRGTQRAKEFGQQIARALKTLGVTVNLHEPKGQVTPGLAFSLDGTPGGKLVVRARAVPLQRDGREVVAANGIPVKVRPLVDPETGEDIDVETEAGRKRAVDVLDECIKSQEETIRRIIDEGKDAKTYFGNLAELITVRGLLLSGVPAYIQHTGAPNTDVIAFKPNGDEAPLMVFYSVKSQTTGETVDAGVLGSHALGDLQASVAGKTITLKDANDKEHTCPAETAVAATMFVHGHLIKTGVGTVDCDAEENKGRNQRKVLDRTSITPDLKASCEAAGSIQADGRNNGGRADGECFKLYVNNLLSKKDFPENLGQLADFSTGQFAQILEDTSSNVAVTNTDIAVVRIAPKPRTSTAATENTISTLDAGADFATVSIVPHELIQTAVSGATKKLEDDKRAQLTDILKLRFSTKCENNRFTRIINTSHPLRLAADAQKKKTSNSSS